MAEKLKFKFDPNQEHQRIAVDSIIRLFHGMPKADTEFFMGEEIIPNLPPYEDSLNEDWLWENLLAIQEGNGVPQNLTGLDVDDGLILEGIGIDSWRYPAFTVEMETGTGKTYVYFRTIHELRKHYGFRKFIVVVPSVAIYEGVIKSFQMTEEHFRTLYGNEKVELLKYDGQQISKVRSFATSPFTQVMVITMDAFNKATNLFYKPTEKLPGEKRPFQYVQETRPILILDESQNYRSPKAKSALRTLNPLFAINYSATPIDKPNLVYRLTPVDAFKMNLVKKIEVLGVSEEHSYGNQQMALHLIANKPGAYGLAATIEMPVYEGGQLKMKQIEVRKGDDLYAKTKNENFSGIRVAGIDRSTGTVEFSSGHALSLGDARATTLSRQELFRIQIEETVRTHFRRQAELREKGIKVLSLFFIDRVANYTAEDGIIRQLFDEAYEKLKRYDSHFKQWTPEQVREAYFAKKKTKEGETEIDTALEENKKTKAEKELEKAAYELIMKNKERLLSFSEKTSFIFAHSALKEGWDNPNVFQICTLNSTVSETKKRQEIGRGLRLCVDQSGERIASEDVNVLTVVANENYETYVANLQMEYRESGDVAPPPPSNARKSEAKRNDRIFNSEDFQNFWGKLCKQTEYQINIDSEQLIADCIAHLNGIDFPEPQIVISKGKFVISDILLRLISVHGGKAKINLEITDTAGSSESYTTDFKKGDDLARIKKDERLRGYKIVEINDKGEDSEVVFGNDEKLTKHTPIFHQSHKGQYVDPRRTLEAQTTYPVFNLIDRTSKEVGLTRKTILTIFKGLTTKTKSNIFKNPEGFSGVFITTIKNELANHITKRIEYIVSDTSFGESVETIFPATKKYPQKELLDGTDASLYDVVQVDSDVEQRFIQHRLQTDDKVICYFKFPSIFRIGIPRIIGNYNPDWGIIRLTDDGKYKLELVRETKGTMNKNLLQYPHEKRKIDCAKRHFDAIGVDYRQITDQTHLWWEEENRT